jgi:hypothetical protein
MSARVGGWVGGWVGERPEVWLYRADGLSLCPLLSFLFIYSIITLPLE